MSRFLSLRIDIVNIANAVPSVMLLLRTFFFFLLCFTCHSFSDLKRNLLLLIFNIRVGKVNIIRHYNFTLSLAQKNLNAKKKKKRKLYKINNLLTQTGEMTRVNEWTVRWTFHTYSCTSARIVEREKVHTVIMCARSTEFALQQQYVGHICFILYAYLNWNRWEKF